MERALKFIRSPWTVILLISVLLFIFWGGPVFTARSLGHGGRLFVSYTFIPLAVIAVLLFKRTWSWVSFLYYTFGIAMIKMLITMSVHMWAQPRDAGLNSREITRHTVEATGSAYKRIDFADPAQIEGHVTNLPPGTPAVAALVGVREGIRLRRQSRSLTLADSILSPAILSANPGDTLQVTNQDKSYHTFALGNPTRQIGQMPLPPGRTGSSRPVSDTGVFDSRCSYGHEDEHTTLLVFPHPYHALVDPDGRFVLDSIPPGKYRLGVWHDTQTRPSLDAPQIVVDVELRPGENALIGISPARRADGPE